MILRVKVKPNSSTDAIEKNTEGHFIVRIKAQPIEGKANKYLISFLAKQLALPKSCIQVIKGETSAFKTIAIEAEEKWIIDKLQNLSI